MAMGGNTGLQSSVLLIREIAAYPARRHAMGSVFHEVRTGRFMGLAAVSASSSGRSPS